MKIYKVEIWLGLLMMGCCFVLPLRAQTEKIDSLRMLINAPQDTLRIRALLQLGSVLKNTAPDSAMALYHKAVDEARAGGYRDLEVEGRKKIGIMYGRRGDYTNALTSFKHALDINRQIGDSLGVAGDLSNLGIVYKYLGDYGRSISLYYQSLAIYDSIGDQSGRAMAYENIGILHDVMNEPDRSMESYFKAMEINRITGGDISGLYNNIGLLKRQTGEYDLALHYLTLFLESTRKSGRKDLEADALNNIGHVHLLKKDYRKTEQFSGDAFNQYLQLDNTRGMHQSSLNLCKMYLAKGDLKKAEYEIARMFGFLDELQSLVNHAETSKLAAEVFAAGGKYAQAFQQMKDYVSIRDSLESHDKIQAYQQWQTRLEVYGKDKQLESQHLELELLHTQLLLNTRFRQLLVLGILLLAVIAFVFMNRSYIRHKANKELIAKNTEIQEQKDQINSLNRELEQRMLRAQINPHFLFNSLSAIQHFISNNDRISALKYLSRFSLLLRQMLEQSGSHRVILAEEIELLKNYLELEALRFDGGFSWSVEADPDVDIYNIEVPILLVQPYVENAILHGLVPKSGHGKLSVHFEDDGLWTKCTIEDNGIGRAVSAARKEGQIKHHVSRGMSITAKRIAMIHDENSDTPPVEILDLLDGNGIPCGTKVIVYIPKN